MLLLGLWLPTRELPLKHIVIPHHLTAYLIYLQQGTGWLGTEGQHTQRQAARCGRAWEWKEKVQQIGALLHVSRVSTHVAIGGGDGGMLCGVEGRQASQLDHKSLGLVSNFLHLFSYQSATRHLSMCVQQSAGCTARPSSDPRPSGTWRT